MNNSIFSKVNLLLLTAALCILPSCEKGHSELPEPQPQEEKKYLTAETGVERYYADEFAEKISREALSLMEKNKDYAELPDKTREVLWKMLTGIGQGIVDDNFKILDKIYGSGIGAGWSREHEWKIEKHCFKYKTISYRGEEIELSGSVTYPVPLSGDPVPLNSFSLISHFFLFDSSFAPTVNRMEPITTRVCFNSAVIEADFEGYGCTYDRPFGSMYQVLARQEVDCAMAAVELMEKEGIILPDTMYSDSWGISLGAGTALSVQRYLENDAPEDVRKRLNFRSSYIAEGPLDMADMLLEQNDCPGLYVQGLSAVCFSWLLTIPEEELGGYRAEDFYSKYILTTIDPNTGLNLFRQMFYLKDFNSLMDTSSDLRYKDIFAYDMLLCSDVLDLTSGKTVLLLDLARKYASCKGWSPRHPVFIIHNTKDLSIPSAASYNVFTDLAGGTDGAVNDNVHFVDAAFLLEDCEKFDVHSFQTYICEEIAATYESPEEAAAKIRKHIPETE